jgi:hypothetical protein
MKLQQINFERSYVKKIKELKELSRYVDMIAEQEQEQEAEEEDGDEYKPLDELLENL